MAQIKNKKILIVGGTGSLGQVLVEHLYNDNELFILSRDETKQWMMQNKYLDYDINYYICDIRDYENLKKAILFIKPEIIINVSAIKQVPTCEMFPYESVKTNILGVENLIKICSEDFEPDVVLGISTDKACKPVNVYGMCKAIGERLYISANAMGKTRFLCVRYGNVMESRGSIIPLYRYRSKTDKMYPLTSKQMTRFFMSLEESVELIITAMVLGKKGDTFIPRVRSGKIIDLAEIFIKRYGGKIKEIGIRPGEKIHEELINEEEIRRTYELDKNYLIIKPFISKLHPKYDLTYGKGANNELKKTDLAKFTSDMFLLTKQKLEAFLDEKKIFERDFRTYTDEEVKF
jgi:UDP-glucose 4-epimerase